VRKGDDFTTFTVPKVDKIRNLKLQDPKGPAQARRGKTLPLPLPLKELVQKNRVRDIDLQATVNLLLRYCGDKRQTCCL
jgi:hypothetical protein